MPIEPESTEVPPEIDAIPTNTEDSPVIESEPTVDDSATVQVDEQSLNMLKSRQKEYKIAALAWKKSGNIEEALKHIKITKEFDNVIAAILQGNSVDLSDMPPSPILPSSTAISEKPPEGGKEEITNQQASAVQPDISGNYILKLLIY